MTMVWWSNLGRTAALSLAGGVFAILALVATVAWWSLRVEQAVLFSELRPQDAAVITGELDKLKIPYTLGDSGASVLVESTQVHATRLKLMGKDLPLHGAVGFELFNHTDFGMTEFAQKINYQRALQGELTRTILSFPEVRDVRVHLALPEQGLFRQSTNRPKAAITLGLRQRQSLRGEQVSGIQRLVAAAVPGLSAQEVTIVDQHGLALTRNSDAQSETVGTARMDLKRETEAYLARKVDAVLERAFGPGQAMSSVDVSLNMDQVRITTEDVIGAPDGKGGAVAGILVRERESARDTAAADVRLPEARGPRGSSMQRDVEYQTGRRVEHVVSQPGTIRRIQVVAVVRHDLSPAQREQTERMVAAAAGASLERGDTIVVQALHAVEAPPVPSVAPVPAPSEPMGAAPSEFPPIVSQWQIAAVAALLVIGSAAARRLRTRARARSLTEHQRQAALQQVQAWLAQPVVDVPLKEKAE
jgi:flagellar M-ring protein FliF